MKRLIVAAAALTVFAGGQDAWAVSPTASMSVSATVTTVCTVSATALTFGEVNQTAVTDGTGGVSVTCTNGGTYNVSLDNGVNAGAGTQRKLVSGANSLNYNLFSDGTHSTAWGSTTGTDTVPGTGTGIAQPLTVYGEIPAGQTVLSGNGTDYADTVTVTVIY